jgi:hypothetical protein
MPLYRVPMVRSEHLELWLEFHGGGVPSERARETERVGWLRQTEMIEASNAACAKRAATAMRPGWVVVGKTDVIDESNMS